jgi:hypothetical protein
MLIILNQFYLHIRLNLQLNNNSLVSTVDPMELPKEEKINLVSNRTYFITKLAKMIAHSTVLLKA